MGKSVKKLEKIVSENGEEILRDKEKANELNRYFSSVGEKTASKIPETERDVMQSVLENKSFHLHELQKPTQEDIEKIVKETKAKNNDMENGINSKIVKALCPAISHTLARLISASIDQSTFPSTLKKAEVIGLFKKGDPTVPGNYRPISLLSPFAKIYEKWIEKCLRSFCDTANILPESQHGFRKFHSVDSMSIPMLEQIAKERDKGKVLVVAFLDCSKAFDSISREVLIRKLEKMGVKGKALELLKSYLSCRVQRVRVGNEYSDCLLVSFGVPQGSILGPLLYLLYCADMEEALKGICDIICFADDTNTISAGNTEYEAMREAEKSLGVLDEWFRANKVKANAGKSKYLIIKENGRKKEEEEEKTTPELMMGGERLQRILSKSKEKENTSVSFVGLQLDETVDFQSHVKKIIKKANFGLFGLSLIRKEINKEGRLFIYHSLIQSHLMQNLLAYGRTNKKNIKKIEKIQRRGVRLVEGKGKRESIEEDMMKNRILPISENYKLINCIWATKIITGTAPEGVSKLFDWMPSQRAKQFRLPRFKKEKNKNLSPVWSISKLWNSLPLELKEKLLEKANLDNEGKSTKTILKRFFLGQSPQKRR